MARLDEIARVLSKLQNDEISRFLHELLTRDEADALTRRWRILQMLHTGHTQREIVKKLGVSLCKVTRGAKILKKPHTIAGKILKEQEHAQQSAVHLS